ncbi:tetratricopeptide repeat protein [Marinicrinis sediminis]|uniref:Tetratricopeptide repeat protein n=1 Tax=Marinicrinis sediminis TaxID=1652465 RepID=A0ABW5RBX4_9BACL
MKARTRQKLNLLLYPVGLTVHRLTFGAVSISTFLSKHADPVDHRHVDQLFQEKGKEAAFDYLNALHLQYPQNPHIWNKQGLYGTRQETYEEALHHLNEALRLDPYCDPALNNKSWALYGQGRYQEALDVIEYALHLDPRDDIKLTNKGNALLQLYRYEEAIQTYEEALALDPTNPHACYGLGMTWKSIRRYADAAKAFETYTTNVPSDIDGWIQLAECRRKQQEYEQELKACLSILELEPNHYGATFHAGEAYLALEWWEKSREHYAAAIAQYPEDAIFHYSLGRSCAQLGDSHAALQSLKQAYRLDHTALISAAEDSGFQPLHHNPLFQDLILLDVAFEENSSPIYH